MPGVQLQRRAGTVKAVLAPDKPGRDAHENKEHSPNRPEQPCRWRPRRLRQLPIEARSVDRRETSDSTGDETGQEPTSKPENLLTCGRVRHWWTMRVNHGL